MFSREEYKAIHCVLRSVTQTWEVFPSCERYSVLNDILDWNLFVSDHRHSETYLSPEFHAHICILEAFLEKATEAACHHRTWLPLWLMWVASEEWHKGLTCCIQQDFILIMTINGPNGEVTESQCNYYNIFSIPHLLKKKISILITSTLAKLWKSIGFSPQGCLRISIIKRGL